MLDCYWLLQTLTGFPTAGSSRIQDGLTNFLGFEGFLESRGARLASFKALQEISHLVYKRMFVSNAKTRYPPFVHVGLFAIGYMDRAPSPEVGLITIVKKFQAVQIMKIPTDGGIGAIYFKRIQRLVSSCLARRFEKAQGSIVELAEERTGVVNVHLLYFSCQLVHAFLDKSFRHA